MKPQFKFHLRATACDREGYYYPRWDKAQHITVIAETKQQAIDKAAVMMGNPPRGRYWGFRTGQIDEYTPERKDDGTA